MLEMSRQRKIDQHCLAPDQLWWKEAKPWCSILFPTGHETLRLCYGSMRENIGNSLETCAKGRYYRKQALLSSPPHQLLRIGKG